MAGVPTKRKRGDRKTFVKKPRQDVQSSEERRNKPWTSQRSRGRRGRGGSRRSIPVPIDLSTLEDRGIMTDLQPIPIWSWYSNGVTSSKRGKHKPELISHPFYSNIRLNKLGIQRVVDKIQDMIDDGFPNFKKYIDLPDAESLVVTKSSDFSYAASIGGIEQTVPLVSFSSQPYPVIYVTPNSIFGSYSNHKAVPAKFNYDEDKVGEMKVLTGGKFVTITTEPNSYSIRDAIIDYFNGSERIKSREILNISVHDALTNSKYKDTALKALAINAVELTNNGKYDVDEEKLIHSLMLLHRTPSLFKFQWAQKILLYLAHDKIKGYRESIEEKKEPVQFLDMSAGWGDRLLASLTIPEIEYTGFDVNADLRPGYEGIKDYMKNVDTKATIYIEPFEETNKVKEDFYDIAFSSPPFFVKEIYGGSRQSTTKFPDYESWMVGFLFASLLKIWKGLKVGGILAVHIADISDERRQYLLSEPMNMFIENNLSGSQFMGCIGLATGEQFDQPSIRIPVWVWKKIDSARAFWTSRPGRAPRPRSLQRMYPAINDKLMQAYVTAYIGKDVNSIANRYIEEALDGQPANVIVFAKKILFSNKLNVLAIKNTLGDDGKDVVLKMASTAYANRGPNKT